MAFTITPPEAQHRKQTQVGTRLDCPNTFTVTPRQAYHKGFDPEHMNPDKITVDLSSSAKAKVVSTRIRCARNLAMFPMNPGGSLESVSQGSKPCRSIWVKS